VQGAKIYLLYLLMHAWCQKTSLHASVEAIPHVVELYVSRSACQSINQSINQSIRKGLE